MLKRAKEKLRAMIQKAQNPPIQKAAQLMAQERSLDAELNDTTLIAIPFNDSVATLAYEHINSEAK